MRAALIGVPPRGRALRRKFRKYRNKWELGTRRRARIYWNEWRHRQLHSWRSCAPARNPFSADPGWRNSMTNRLQEDLARHLSDSVERLHKQVEKVDFWTSALTGFAQPVPQ
jgi:hypothetical protein